MDLATISAFFGDTVPIGVVFLIAHQIYLANEMRHIRKDLSNHITDTNKKIEDTRRELVSLRKDTNEQIKETREELVSLRKDTNGQFSRLYELLIQDRKQKQAKQ